MFYINIFTGSKDILIFIMIFLSKKKNGALSHKSLPLIVNEAQTPIIFFFEIFWELIKMHISLDWCMLLTK